MCSAISFFSAEHMCVECEKRHQRLDWYLFHFKLPSTDYSQNVRKSKRPLVKTSPKIGQSVPGLHHFLYKWQTIQVQRFHFCSVYHSMLPLAL